MFKNFLDKAKSAIDDVDNALKLANLSGSQVKAKKAVEYDASFFTFQLEGGPLHSSKLNAVAKIKAGIEKEFSDEFNFFQERKQEK